MPTFLRMLFKVSLNAFFHFAEDDGWAMASHVALSILLAVFPFLIFGTALAGFLGADQFSETAVHIIFDTWPAAIAKPISDQVKQVLTIPRGGLLTVSVLAAAYFASNGVEALRISLNRAYRVAETRPWYITRLASLGYVLVAVMIVVAISILLVAVPIALAFAGKWFPWMTEVLAAISSWRVYGTLAVLAVGLLAAHLWLPAGRRGILAVLPGVALTLIAWLAGALIFASYLATFANYAATYAGLASVMIVLVFLYMVGVIFILGAEFNAALQKYRVLHTLSRSLATGSRKPDPASETDEPSDIRR